MPRNTNRRAVTLVEVLIAIFLMGIGLMAILSLFPLGAAQMAQALQDQRAAEAATTAAAYARVMWKQAVAVDPNDAQAKFVSTTDWNTPNSPQLFITAMDNPNLGLSSSSVPNTAMQPMPRPGATASVAGTPSATGASYPVLVDPIGWSANQGNPGLQAWVGYSAAAPKAWCIPRRTLYMPPPGTMSTSTQWVPVTSLGTLAVFKQFSLMDDMTFNFGASPSLSANPVSTPKLQNGSPSTDPVERQGRYSWAFMFRRGNNADRQAAEISTILYSGRSLDVASPETAYTGTIAFPTVASGVTPTTKTLTLFYTAPKPAIRRGGWILDATLVNVANNVPDPQGIFYRVVNVDDSTPGSLTLELQTPIVGKSSPSVTQTTQRTIVVMEKVVDVFVKKDVSSVAPPMPY
jgi:Tfp pilus assembly protein PilV